MHSSPIRYESSPTEHEALACLPEEGAPAANSSQTRSAVDGLVSAFSSMPPLLRTSGNGTPLEALSRCGDNLFKTAVSCGTVIALAPQTLGTSLLAAVPCALEAASLGKCLGDESAQTEVSEQVDAYQEQCEATGGVAIPSDTQVTCLIVRDR